MLRPALYTLAFIVILNSCCIHPALRHHDLTHEEYLSFKIIGSVYLQYDRENEDFPQGVHPLRLAFHEANIKNFRGEGSIGYGLHVDSNRAEEAYEIAKKMLVKYPGLFRLSDPPWPSMQDQLNEYRARSNSSTKDRDYFYKKYELGVDPKTKQ